MKTFYAITLKSCRSFDIYQAYYIDDKTKSMRVLWPTNPGPKENETTDAWLLREEKEARAIGWHVQNKDYNFPKYSLKINEYYTSESQASLKKLIEKITGESIELHILAGFHPLDVR